MPLSPRDPLQGAPTIRTLLLLRATPPFEDDWCIRHPAPRLSFRAPYFWILAPTLFVAATCCSAG